LTINREFETNPIVIGCHPQAIADFNRDMAATNADIDVKVDELMQGTESDDQIVD
jgi:hypothetical protein